MFILLNTQFFLVNRGIVNDVFHLVVSDKRKETVVTIPKDCSLKKNTKPEKVSEMDDHNIPILCSG